MPVKGSSLPLPSVMHSETIVALTWVDIGLQLLQVEADASWAKTSSGFSDWLEGLAKRHKVDASSCWRYLGALKFYAELRTVLLAHGVECPMVHELPSSVSAEGLEILSKLSRVVPDVQLVELAKRLLAHDVTRSELRKRWQLYRPALSGRTARGRGVGVPLIDQSDVAHRVQVRAAEMVLCITKIPCEWIGVPRPFMAQSFLDVTVTAQPSWSLSNASFDVIYVVKKEKFSSMELHGVDVRKSFSVTTLKALAHRSLWVDYLWVAFLDPVPGGKLDALPANVGVLSQDGDSIKVLKHAKRNVIDPEVLLLVTRDVLQRAIGR